MAAAWQGAGPEPELGAHQPYYTHGTQGAGCSPVYSILRRPTASEGSMDSAAPHAPRIHAPHHGAALAASQVVQFQCQSPACFARLEVRGRHLHMEHAGAAEACSMQKHSHVPAQQHCWLAGSLQAFVCTCCVVCR